MRGIDFVAAGFDLLQALSGCCPHAHIQPLFSARAGPPGLLVLGASVDAVHASASQSCACHIAHLLSTWLSQGCNALQCRTQRPFNTYLITGVQEGSEYVPSAVRTTADKFPMSYKPAAPIASGFDHQQKRTGLQKLPSASTELEHHIAEVDGAINM